MEERAKIVRDMKICRFCLEEKEPLTKIFDKANRQPIPLTLQLMACVAIEVFVTDGMPQYICNQCRTQTIQAYNFKTTCKKSDDALKLFIATGKLIKPSSMQGLIRVINPYKKRTASDADLSPTKQQSKYSAGLEIGQHRIVGGSVELQKKQVLREPEHILGVNNEEDQAQYANFEEMVEDIDGDMDEEMQSDGEDNVNPVLKVPQVATDVFPCEHCDRSFPLQQLLDIHSKIHERDRTFACEECSRKFFTKYDLGKHLQTHTDTKPYACVICNKQFSRETLLHRHEKIHVDVPTYMCTFCERTFLTREDLDVHSEKHKKRRPFQCRLCNKSFVFKQGLERHELAHADHKPHKCNYCEASFTSPIKLTRHVTSHAGLRPYPCKICGRTFLLSHHLTRHTRSHYANQNYLGAHIGQHKCDICSMSFRRKDSLINHSAIHSMVNLRCVICNTNFETAKMVKEHITTHLSGLPYPCDRCDYSFDTQDQLEEHELKHVEMEYEEQIEKEVSLEAQAQSQEEIDEEYGSAEELEDDNGIAEYTITNPDNPEVVRRSKRGSKIRNYADFLKDEAVSDNEEEPPPQEDNEEFLGEPIKPVVRSEGTKMYTRKATPTKPKVVQSIKPPLTMMAPLDEINQPIVPSLDSLALTKQAANALVDKKYIDMKIGDKTVRIQKLMMTKSEIQAMARQGKIEMKGNTYVLKANRTMSQQSDVNAQKSTPTTLNSLMNSTKFPQLLQTVKKTYVKRIPSSENCGIRQLNDNLIAINESDIQTVSMSEVEINSQEM